MPSGHTTYTTIADMETAIDSSALKRGYEFKGLLKSMVRSLGGSLLIDSTAVTGTNAQRNSYAITVDIDDLSAEASYYINATDAGTISKIYAVSDGAIATADVTITAKIATVAVTNGVVTLPTAGSAAGTTASATPTAANTVTTGQAIELLVSGGGAGGTPRGHVTIVITRT